LMIKVISDSFIIRFYLKNQEYFCTEVENSTLFVACGKDGPSRIMSVPYLDRLY
jgi:hypothetical protein